MELQNLLYQILSVKEKRDTKMEFYSVVLRKKVQIPEKNVRTVTKSGRKFAVGKYTANGKTYEAWRILAK